MPAFDFCSWVDSYYEEMLGTGDDMHEQKLILSTHMLTRANKTPGRRFRVFAATVSAADLGVATGLMNLGEAYEVASSDPCSCPRLAALSMRKDAPGGDPELPPYLQDLGWMIGYDLTEACAALNDPDVWYPGVDEGIDPVPDAHVEKVIAATQRELNRELRHGRNGSPRRPAVPLAELPWRIQRAFVERRRLRYQQWGIGREQWERGTFSLWDVQEDAEWVPPWAA